ncbi:aspartate aminotransferase, cytoplasmic-like [Schistocerca serialis cubense]|uniref:aspartate aminotransferase, cytoplasmic-like n=1 Tax=Schistocerca serialis cubense TaxID=2023355 RepID=UPI00214E64D6|nr:aspartate aminotransferase, cytoplasmic-like [Schistocerca serialis cubense]
MLGNTLRQLNHEVLLSLQKPLPRALTVDSGARNALADPRSGRKKADGSPVRSAGQAQWRQHSSVVPSGGPRKQLAHNFALQPELYPSSAGPVSRFEDVEFGTPIEVHIVRASYNADPFEKKVDLGVGAYRTEEGRPWVMPWVYTVRQQLAHDPTLNHEYLPFLGCERFTRCANELLLGDNSPAIHQGKVFGIQSLSGAGSVRIAFEFLCKVMKYKTVFIPLETWENHYRLVTHGGFSDVREYRYWNTQTRKLDFEGLIEDLSGAPADSVVVLHPCAHNPTGCDPSHEQWDRIADIIEERRLFPFFDIAYQGLASGDIDEDAWAVRRFAERGIEFFSAQSFSKNCGLYGERTGNLAVMLNNPDKIEKVKSQFIVIARSIYCSPPSQGARIVTTMLEDPKLKEEWKTCLREMTNRIKDMRKGLKERLDALGTPGSWDHITQQVGFFSFTGLSERQVQLLREKYHVYMLSNGRANMCGLNTKNLDYTANAIHDIVTRWPEEDKNPLRA